MAGSSDDAYGRLLVTREVDADEHERAVARSLKLLRSKLGAWALDADRSMLPVSKLANALALRVPCSRDLDRDTIESWCDVWSDLEHQALTRALAQPDGNLMDELNRIARDAVVKRLFGKSVARAKPISPIEGERKVKVHAGALDELMRVSKAVIGDTELTGGMSDGELAALFGPIEVVREDGESTVLPTVTPGVIIEKLKEMAAPAPHEDSSLQLERALDFHGLREDALF